MPTQQPSNSSRNLTPAAYLSLLNDYHLLSCEEIDSTNEEAKRLARGGGSHGAVIWAKEQRAGRGRAGRSWSSPPGNLYCSVLLQPGCDLDIIAQLTYVAAVAVHETLSGILPEPEAIALKWPNDVLVNGKKIAGILLESFAVDSQSPRWVAVGVGINVDNSPKDVSFPATSLKEEGVEIISAKIVLSRFIHTFIETYNLWSRKGFAPVRKAWLSNAWGLDSDVRISLPQEELYGIFKSIDKDGGLVLELSPKERRTIHAGDILFLPETQIE